MNSALIEVADLRIGFPRGGGMRDVVAGIGYTLERGRTLGVVGESGCGKSMTALALMGLVPTPGYVGGSIRFESNELIGQPASAWRARYSMLDEAAALLQAPDACVGVRYLVVDGAGKAVGFGMERCHGSVDNLLGCVDGAEP